MKKLVEIEEINRRLVIVNVPDDYENWDVEEKVSDAWNNGKIILDADDFVEANFKCIGEPTLEQINFIEELKEGK